MITLDRARQALGEAGRNIPDSELEEMCREAEALARWLYGRLVAEEEQRERRNAA